MNLLKKLFSKKNTFSAPKFSEQELKQRIKILIIDDHRNDLDKNLNKHGWSTEYIKDLESYEQTELKNANIICIDINGVGAKLGCSGEGMELSQRIKTIYPEKKIILYSSQRNHDIFSESLNHVDKRVYKSGEFYPFLSAVKELSENIFNWDSCIDFIYEKYHASFTNKIARDEFKLQIEKSISHQHVSKDAIMKITGLVVDGASIIVKILEICLAG